MDDGTWRQVDGPGATALLWGLILVVTAIFAFAMLVMAERAGEFPEGGSELAIGASIATGVVALGLVFLAVGLRSRGRRRRAAAGVRAEGVVTARKVVVRREQGTNSRSVYRYTVTLDPPVEGASEVSARARSGPQVGSPVVVRFAPGEPGHAVLMGYRNPSEQPGVPARPDVYIGR